MVIDCKENSVKKFPRSEEVNLACIILFQIVVVKMQESEVIRQEIAKIMAEKTTVSGFPIFGMIAGSKAFNLNTPTSDTVRSKPCKPDKIHFFNRRIKYYDVTTIIYEL
jgi:hypothetical protein